MFNIGNMLSRLPHRRSLHV